MMKVQANNIVSRILTIRTGFRRLIIFILQFLAIWKIDFAVERVMLLYYYTSFRSYILFPALVFGMRALDGQEGHHIPGVADTDEQEQHH